MLSPHGCRRPGFSLLEFEVALVLLGIALTGLFPLVAIYSKGVTALEAPAAGPRQLRYVVPSSDPWRANWGPPPQVTATPPAPTVPPPFC